MNGISCGDERPEQERRAGLLSEAWRAEVSNGRDAMNGISCGDERPEQERLRTSGTCANGAAGPEG
jgi:hypothetical protein